MIAAIGEIGLDYKYESAFEKQLLVFDKMLNLAEKLNLPVIIHSRGTTSQIIEMLPSYNIKRILLHWFSYPISALSKAIEHGYNISEGPPLVYSSGIQKIVKEVPITNLLSETDGPVTYYKPPFNGKLTTPSLIPRVIEVIAKVKNMSLVEVADQIVENFQNFFNIKLH
jgi:TatD DNase family protein